jgi:hypothetical protein
VAGQTQSVKKLKSPVLPPILILFGQVYLHDPGGDAAVAHAGAAAADGTGRLAKAASGHAAYKEYTILVIWGRKALSQIKIKNKLHGIGIKSL